MFRSNRLLLAATAAAAGLAAGVPAAQAAPAAVLSPADDSLATGTVDVKVRLPAGATKVSARVAGTDVKLRGRGTVRTASIRVGKLKPGRTTLTLRAAGKDGKRLSAHSHFVIGKPKPTLLKGAAKVTQGRGTASLKLNLRARPTTLRIKLNGKRVELLQRPTSGATTVRLSAADGLRFGRNTVTLRAYDRRDGRWARVTTRFKMSGKLPLASAGRDVGVDAGAKVRLSATGTKTRGNQLPLGYSWRIVDQPRGAKAKLIGATSKRPSIKTTRPGRYAVELRLTKRARRAHAAAATALASDVVNIDASASIPPFGTPLTTLVDNGNGTYRTTVKGIPLDGSNDYIDAANSDVTVIVLDQKTLGVVSAGSGGGDPESLFQAIDQIGEDQIGIVAAPAGCCDWQGTLGPISNMNGGWTIVFNGDAGADGPMAVNAGNVTVPGGKPGAISAVVRKGTDMTSLTKKLFTVVETDTMGFDSRIPKDDGSMMALGPVWATYSGTGIGVLAVNADLATAGFNHFFPLTGDPTADAAQLNSLNGQLQAIAGQNGAVVMLQTYGKPKATTAAWGQVGQSLALFGGTPTVWDRLDGSGDYALVGRAGAAASALVQESASSEASAPLTQATDNDAGKAGAGTLRGFVGRGIDSLPVIAASTSLPTIASKDINGQPEQIGPFQMIGLASQPPQPWPAGDTPGKQAAFRWISQQLNLGDPTIVLNGACYQPTTWDLRAVYCDASHENSWDEDLTTLAGLKFPTDQSDFTADDFNAVVGQLKLEFPMISEVFGTIDALKTAVGNAQARTVQDVTTAISDVDQSLSSNQTKGSSYSMATFVSSLLDPLTKIALPEDSADAPAFGLGLIESGIELGLGAATDEDGNPALAAFDSDKDSIANDAVNRLAASTTQLDLLEQILLTDWTKLSTTAHYSTTAWGISGLDVDTQTAVVEASTRSWLYKTALPIAYWQIGQNPTHGSTQSGMVQMTCKYDGGNGILYTRWPWIPGATPNIGSGAPSGGTPVPESAVFAPAAGTNDDGSPIIGSVFGLGNAINQESLQVPAQSLTDLLFKAVTDTSQDGKNGIGLYPEQFYTWGWVGGNRFMFSDKKVQDGLSDPEKCFF